MTLLLLTRLLLPTFVMLADPASSTVVYTTLSPEVESSEVKDALSPLSMYYLMHRLTCGACCLCSCTQLDYASYLDKLKVDLHIGEEGYPQKIMLTGDQQTYKLTKDLQNQYPLKYKWFCAVPGDSHLLKLTAELLKRIIWDGGFKQMCIECGHKKGITQWADIHIMLSSLHEVLLRICTIKI